MDVDNIPTAKEILQTKRHYSDNYEESEYVVPFEDAEEALLEFAILHVKAALEAVNKNADIVCKKGEDYDCKACMGGGCEEPIVDKNSILNAYSLDNIK